MQNKTTEKLLLSHCERYKKLNPEDVFKFLYHSAFGCEHAVSSLSNAVLWIERERENVLSSGEIELLDGDYCRVPLSLLSPDTLGKLFYLSAKKEEDGAERLTEKLSVAKALARQGLLPFEASVFCEKAERWERDGFPALHHSDTFKKEYNPAYRVISSRFIPFLPLFSEIDKRLANGCVTLAIDGRCAGGKSTLGELLSSVYEAALFHADDFFLPPDMRTPARLSEAGGNLDRERLKNEVLVPLKSGHSVNYRRFDCYDNSLTDPVLIKPQRLNIIEGSYSMHPLLESFYDLSVFLSVDKTLQRERILKRNPELAGRFFEEWIPLEEQYFKETDIARRADIVINIKP